MKTTTSTTKEVTVIGGGASGALTAYHLLLQGVVSHVTIIDPNPSLGLGLAYRTPSLCHLLNVPAGKISALSSQPNHFLNWLRIHYDANATSATFAPRAIFGQYVQQIIADVRGIHHLQNQVVDLSLREHSILLYLQDGATLETENLVIATGNFSPATLPGIDSEAIAQGFYCNNAWSSRTYTNLDLHAPVTLIGSGLTAVDVVLRLRELGHSGSITAISRHGIFPNRHTPYVPLEHAVIPDDTPKTCVAYLKNFHTAIRSGIAWQAAVDSLRSTTNDLWLALSLREQKRFRRHLQRRWEVVRHRMAPPIANQIDAELASQSLVLKEGSFVGVKVLQPHRAEVTLRTADGEQVLTTARVINCTGPSMNYRRVGSRLLENLLARGIAISGPLGTGLSTTRSGAFIDHNGVASDRIFLLGPGRLGTLLESIAIPEIREQAVEIATILTQKLSQKKLATGVSAAYTDKKVLA